MRTVKNKLQTHSNDDQGFSLVEMAIVLIIFGLFLSATLIPLSVQRDLSDYKTARADLEQIKEALYGYAVANGNLPCPDTNDDGKMNSPCSGGSIQGNIPWVDLGVPRVDPWNQYYRYRVDQAFTTTITLSTKPSSTTPLAVKDKAIGGNLLANGVPAVIYSSGKNGAIQVPKSSDDEIENTAVISSKYDNNFVSHEITTDFDDVVVWLSSSILFNRMVSAQKLP